MKKRVIEATLWYLGMLVLFGLSFCLWYFGAKDSIVTQQALSVFGYFGLVPFQWTFVNCSAFLFAQVIMYVLFVGMWLGVDKVVGE